MRKVLLIILNMAILGFIFSIRPERIVTKTIYIEKPCPVTYNKQAILQWMIRNSKPNVAVSTLKEIEQTVFKISKYPLLTLAVISTESSFDPQAYNKRYNDVGLMQINVKIWNREIKKQKLTTRQLFEIDKNIQFGNTILENYISRYGLLQGLKRYHGNGKYYTETVLKRYGELNFIAKK